MLRALNRRRNRDAHGLLCAWLASAFLTFGLASAAVAGASSAQYQFICSGYAVDADAPTAETAPCTFAGVGAAGCPPAHFAPPEPALAHGVDPFHRALVASDDEAVRLRARGPPISV